MILNLKIVRVDSNYCDYLRQFDSRVPYNNEKKELRPFVGILFNVNECEYFAPLSSPKPKHKNMSNGIDFLKIADGDLGAVNFNNMIPVESNNYWLVDLNREYEELSEQKYYILLSKQLEWLDSNYDKVKKKSSKLYHLYTNNKLPNNIKNRCCNFKLLEEKCALYNENYSYN